MAKPFHLTRRLSFAALLRPNSLVSTAAATPPFFAAYNPISFKVVALSHSFSTTLTPYPLQYDIIVSRPVNSPPRRRLPTHLAKTRPDDSEPDSEIGFDEWVDKKLTANQESGSGQNSAMDKSKRKYYNKKMKRMYGSDSEDDRNQENGDDFVELKPEVVELRTLHKREEELYFYDTFAYPWEKEKHYKMVYQLEKKYFPDQCFDKAFLEPGELNDKAKKKKNEGVKESVEKNEKGLVFFDEEKKVEEFFNTLKKFPKKDDEVVSAEPFIATRSTGLPSKWDSPTGTVVLVNKPKDSDGRNLVTKDRRSYDIAVFLTSYSEVHGLSMGYLEKVDGFKSVFKRKDIGGHAIKWLENFDTRLFSHQIPARKLSGKEASVLAQDCWELDPASLPAELLAIGWGR